MNRKDSCGINCETFIIATWFINCEDYRGLSAGGWGERGWLGVNKEE
jgi:hypothetical protein